MSRTIQSSDYVPGVSGWKIDTDTGAFEFSSDRVTVSGVDPKALYSGKSRQESQKPFIVVDGVTYVREASVSESSIASPWPAAWGVRMQRDEKGNYYAAGIEVGLPSQIVVSADRFAINGRSASDILEMFSGNISRTDMVDHMKSLILESQVKEVIRAELKPGGLLHRSR